MYTRPDTEATIYVFIFFGVVNGCFGKLVLYVQPNRYNVLCVLYFRTPGHLPLKLGLTI